VKFVDCILVTNWPAYSKCLMTMLHVVGRAELAQREKEREERIRRIKEMQEEERKKKLEELKQHVSILIQLCNRYYLLKAFPQPCHNAAWVPAPTAPAPMLAYNMYDTVTGTDFKKFIFPL
jgi:hypothetical protein